MTLDTTSAASALGARYSSPLWLRIWRVVAMLHGPVLIGLFYLMWFSARLVLGRWPRWGGADDPKSIPVTWLVDMALSLWFLLVPFVIVFATVRFAQGPQPHDHTARQYLLESLITIAGLFGTGIFLAVNPHHLVTWFMD